MPGRDSTGPMGQGPMTGRQLGFCNSNIYRNGVAYRQFGGGFGRGRGFNRFSSFDNEFFPESYSSSETEIEILKRQSKELKDNLNQIEKRIELLKKEPDQSEKKEGS